MRKVLAMSYAPTRYVRGESIENLRQALEEKFGKQTALFSSGREALLALLKAIGLKAGEEIIVQGYTCVVVPNAIHAAGGVPIYADIDQDSLNLTIESVATCITPRTRAVMCQHTFGIPSDTRALRSLCDKHGLLLIEDCAHVLPDETGPKAIAQWGDAMLMSFGRDKAISGIAGGAIAVHNPTIAAKVKKLEKDAAAVSWWKTLVLLEYPARMQLIRALAWSGLQKPILALLNLCGFFAPILTQQEREGYMSPVLHKIPNACAFLALHSLSRLTAINDHRRELTEFYLSHGTSHAWPMLESITQEMPLQKFPLFVSDASGKRKKLKTTNIHLDDGWTGCVVCPDTVTMDATGYVKGADTIAESACMQILSLPTNPTMTMEQAKRLAEIIDVLLKD